MEKSSKISTIILWVLMVISIVLFIFMFTAIDNEINPGAKAVQLITLNINWSIALFALSAVIVLLFSFLQVFTDKSKMVSTLAIVVIFAAVIGIGYALANSEIPSFIGVEKFIADGIINETISKWIGTGLNITYILFGGAFLSIVGFSAVNLFKR